MLHRRLFAIAGLCLLLAACGKASSNEPLKVENAWIRLPAVPGRPGAAYFTIVSQGEAARLQQIASPRIERIELHESAMDDGMMRMKPLAGVDIPTNGTVAFKPGGAHAMLFGIDPGVKPGDRIALTFTVPPNAPITAEAEVHSAGDAGHSGH